jgi:hypothetical protein
MSVPQNFCQSIGEHCEEFDFNDNLLGGLKGLGLSMMCSENYGNSAHCDTDDCSDTLSGWFNGAVGDPELRNFFLFPNLRINGSHGVAIKLYDGVIVVFDGQKLRHCTSVPTAEDGEALPNDRLENRWSKGGEPSVPNQLVFGFGHVLCGNFNRLKRPREVLPIRSKEERKQRMKRQKV